MLSLLGLLLVIWIIISVIGFVVEGLVWLAIIGLVLFAVTGLFGWLKGKARGQG